MNNEIRYDINGLPQFVVFNNIIYRVLRVFIGTKNYYLGAIKSEDWDVELSNPTNGDKSFFKLHINYTPYNIRITDLTVGNYDTH